MEKRSTGRIVVLLSGLLLITALVRGAMSRSLEVSLSDVHLTMIGEEDGDWNAYFASPAGDVNGDGLGDAFIGAPMAGNKVCPYPPDDEGNCPGLPKGEGVAYLVLGRADGQWSDNALDLADADASFLGCETASMTARQLYTAGDVNGDGYDDLLISGWKCGQNYTGKAYLFLGRPDVETWGYYYPVEEADASFLGENEKDFLSYYTATAGDVNGDGFDDFLISSTHYDITGTEVITDPGKIYLILGRAEADWGRDYPLSQADASFLGEEAGDRLGRAQVGVGDVNGDGYGDFLIGSISSNYNGENAGQNYLFLGRAAPGDADYDPAQPWWGNNAPVDHADASFVGEAAGDESGRRVAWAGDVNGDGYDDFLMGAALNDQSGPDAGIAHLILGRPEADWGVHYPLCEADASFIGEERRDQAGRRLNGAGDVNGDGYADFLIGAPHNNRGGFAAGAAYLIYGRPEADWGRYYPLSKADAIYVGKPDVGVAGYDVAWLGDFNGDAVDDFMIAAYGGRNEEHTPGEAYIILGSMAPQPVSFTPAVESGVGAQWQHFVAEYRDPNGWQDLAQTRMLLEDSSDASHGFDVRYDQNHNHLYLYDPAQDRWLGPCLPGELARLSNQAVQLDCRASNVIGDDSRFLKLVLSLRWLQKPDRPILFDVYLQASDAAGHDSGLLPFGTWQLLPEPKLYLPLVRK
ncbi:MAG: integrin alpha [Chloroflexota bacterium]